MSDPLGDLFHREGSSAAPPHGSTTQGNTTMKQMILTGLATEHRFGSPDPQFYLVFNEGELRVPVAAQAAEAVVQMMYGTNGVEHQAQQTPSQDEDAFHTDADDGFDNESDIPQA